MKVVVVGTRGFPNVQGGVVSLSEHISFLLVKEGCDVTVIARSEYVGKVPFEYAGVKVVPLPCVRNKHLESFFHTFIGVCAARGYRPDVLHLVLSALGSSLFWRDCWACMSCKQRMHRHLKWGFITRIFLRFCEFVAAVFSNRIIAVSEYIAGELKH